MATQKGTVYHGTFLCSHFVIVKHYASETFFILKMESLPGGQKYLGYGRRPDRFEALR